MSSLVFATCERRRALGFLNKLFPSATLTDTADSAKAVLDFVEADVIRIGDPDFHRGAVFASKGTPDQIAEAIAALRVLQDGTMAAIKTSATGAA